MNSSTPSPLLQVENLAVHFPMARTSWLQRGPSPVLQAVSDVSFSIQPGETLALVGESGCGKTTLGRALVGLYATTRGSVRFKGQELGSMNTEQRQQTRCAIQMIFQDPYESLNPRLPVSDVITEPLLIHGIGNRAERAERARELIAQVGLPVDALNRYPHQFSGGQRQRIAIARALAVQPKLLILDEPTSALDVSVQAQILNLLADLRRQHGLAYLFITHNLAVVSYLADRVAVMYRGRIVETGHTERLLDSPAHPYTRLLLDSAPGRGKLEASAADMSRGDSGGCAFAARCPRAATACAVAPVLHTVSAGQAVACHHPMESLAG